MLQQLKSHIVCWMCLVASTVVCLDVRLPPTITKGPIMKKIYRPDNDFQLDCEASGTPEPSYSWLKDGLTLVPTPSIQYIGHGSILIRPLSNLHEGYYQCLATNMHGTAMSNVTYLQRAVLVHMRQSTVDEKHGLVEGQPFILEYSPTKCVPPPIVTWGIASEMVDSSQTAVVTDKRVQVDEFGNLHFSYLTMSDMQDGRLYKCNVFNPHLDFTIGGCYSRLHINPAGGVKPFGPVHAFSSQTPIALVGRNVTLRCFFSGFPEPTLAWSKVHGTLPIGRYTLNNYNTELEIRNVRPEDEGDYLCRASNMNGIQDHIIQIDVQVSPVFRSISDRPHNINATEGDTVVVSCKAAAEPTASVVWLRNGVVLNPDNMPPRMRLRDEGTELVLSDVCKDCDDGTSDLQVIQCNASNVHGYAFGDGYINVLYRTKIIDPPMEMVAEYSDSYAEFNCSAVSDDSTPVIIKWEHFDRHNDKLPVQNVTGRTVIHPNGTLSHHVPVNSTDIWVKLSGTYRCNATNEYSSAVAEATLDVILPSGEIIAPVPGGQVAAASLSDWWWLFLLIAIILLLLILIVCCCVCLARRRGDTYKVDEKERKNGNDPEKELIDSGFHDYRRPDSEPLKGSRASLVSSKASDDASSLNEYGDIDAGKFTEDGSFIGDYGTNHRPQRGRPTEYTA